MEMSAQKAANSISRGALNVLDPVTKLELESEILRGNPGALLYRLQRGDAKVYLEACNFAIALLRRARNIPQNVRGAFRVNQSPFMGPTLEFCQYPTNQGTDKLFVQGRIHPTEGEEPEIFGPSGPPLTSLL